MKTQSRCHEAIKSALEKLLDSPFTGQAARRFQTLTRLTAGLLTGQEVRITQLTKGQPSQIQALSEWKKTDRWLTNKWIDTETYYHPVAKKVLAAVAKKQGKLVFAIDGSQFGPTSEVLMMSVLQGKKALPIVWIVEEGAKGHFSQATHRLLLARLLAVIGSDLKVCKVLLADGEFDGSGLLSDLRQAGFEWVLRTRLDRQFTHQGEVFAARTISGGSDSVWYVPDCQLSDGTWTHLVSWHLASHPSGLYLLTSFENGYEAVSYYRLRFKIETFFKDQKSNGFHWERSCLGDAERINRLLIICALAYLWMIGLGLVLGRKKSWLARVYRVDRDDRSLFALGRKFMDYLITNQLRVPDLSKLCQT